MGRGDLQIDRGGVDFGQVAYARSRLIDMARHTLNLVTKDADVCCSAGRSHGVDDAPQTTAARAEGTRPAASIATCSSPPPASLPSTNRVAASPASLLGPDTVLLTTDEAAALLRTSRKAIYAMAERHQLPGVTRIGRRLLVRRDDLLSWLDERRAASPGGTRR
jgi:excisionase family DNA binding protein